MKTLAEALREHRAAKGLSQEALSVQLGVSQSQLGHYETGENGPTLRILQRMVRALGLTAREIGEVVLSSEPSPPRKNQARRRPRLELAA